MRKCFHGVLAICLMGGIQACAPKACDEDPGYRAARIQLDRGDKALEARSFHAADTEYLKGVSQLGQTYRLDKKVVLDDTGMGLIAAEDEDRRGQQLWAAKERRGELQTRLSMYRQGHNCSGN